MAGAVWYQCPPCSVAWPYCITVSVNPQVPNLYLSAYVLYRSPIARRDAFDDAQHNACVQRPELSLRETMEMLKRITSPSRNPSSTTPSAKPRRVSLKAKGKCPTAANCAREPYHKATRSIRSCAQMSGSSPSRPYYR